MSITRALGVFAFVCLAFAGTARADEDDTAKARAREHYIAGTKLFDLGKYNEAVKEYELAYQAKDDPALLYNLGQAHRLAGNTNEALRSYQVFLLKVPRAPNRAEVVAKIRELEKLQEQQRRSATMPPAGTIQPEMKPGETRPQPRPEPKPEQPVAEPEPKPEPKPEHPVAQPEPKPEPTPPAPGRTKKIAGLVVGGVGVAAAVAGIALGAMAIGFGNDVTAAAMAGDKFDPSKEDNGTTFEVVGGVMVGIGVAAIAAGVTTFVLGHLEAKKAARASVTPILGQTQAGVQFRLEF